MSDLHGAVRLRVQALRRVHPDATDEAWAALLVDAIRRYADAGPTERLEVCALAGLATLPKLVSESGTLRKPRAEQILVTPRAHAKAKGR